MMLMMMMMMMLMMMMMMMMMLMMMMDYYLRSRRTFNRIFLSPCGTPFMVVTAKVACSTSVNSTIL